MANRCCAAACDLKLVGITFETTRIETTHGISALYESWWKTASVLKLRVAFLLFASASGKPVLLA